MKHRNRFRCLAAGCGLALLLSSCAAPSAEVTPTPEPTPPPAVTSSPTPEPGGQDVVETTSPPNAAEPLTVECGGTSISWQTNGWGQDLFSGAPTVPWDSELSLFFTPQTSISSVKIQRTVINHLGQEFFPDRREVEADLTEQGFLIRHEPFGGLWDLPLSEPYSPEITVGYYVTLTTGTETESVYFAVKSEFPTIASVSLRERMQSSVDCGETLRVLKAEGDTDGDGEMETVCVGITRERIPFLSVNGKVVLSLRHNNESYYDGATLYALDLDGDKRDEVVVLIDDQGCLGNTLRLQSAEYENDCWQELSVPQLETNIPETRVMDTERYSVSGEGISLESIWETFAGDVDGVATYTYLRVPVTLRLRDGQFHMDLGEPQKDPSLS